MKTWVKYIILTALALTMMMVLTACGGKSLDMTEYTNVSFNGLDGKGSAAVTIDYNKLANTLFGEEPALTDLEKIADYTKKRFKLEMAVSCEFEQKNDLSNGDSFPVTIRVNEAYTKELGFSVKKTELSFKVSDLREPEIIDAFQDVVVKYIGFAPYAEADVLNNSTDEFLQRVNYTADPAENLSNGDVVTVTAEYPSSLADEYGYILQSETKEYTVEGLGAYVTEESQIDQACLDAMKQQGFDIVEAELANTSPNGIVRRTDIPSYFADKGTSGEVTLVNAYLLTLKSGFQEDNKNIYTIVYKVPETLYDGGKLVYDDYIYLAVTFYNLTMNEGGKTTVDMTKSRYKQMATNTDKLYTDQISVFKSKYIVKEITFE